MDTRFYAVAHHGTAGMEWSNGYAEVIEAIPSERPRGSETMTVAGPFSSRHAAENEVTMMNLEIGRFMRPEACYFPNP